MNSAPSKRVYNISVLLFLLDKFDFGDLSIKFKMAAVGHLGSPIEVVSSDKIFPYGLRNNCAKGEHCNPKRTSRPLFCPYYLH